MLVAESLQKAYPTRSGPLPILHDVTLRLDDGDAASIMGPSGCGKSTLLNILGTLETPDAGTLRIGKTNPFVLDEHELAGFRNRRIGFVFQEHHLLPQCSVLENVLVPTLVHARDGDEFDRARTLLERVGLAERLGHLPSELSGGERQRVAIARALINKPVVLLADEPTGNLDRHTAERVADLLVGLSTDESVALIVVTHSEALADRFGRRYELVDGRLSPR